MSTLPISNDLRVNPLRRIREANNLSRLQVANEVGMTPGAVLKYEQGLYEKPSTSLIQFYVDKYAARAVDLVADYDAWRHWKRINSRLPSPSNIWLGPLNKHPLTNYRRAVGYDSVLSFCTELCLHPSVVSKYERGGSATLPHQVEEALSEAGWSDEEIGIIRRYGADYYDTLLKDD